MDPALVRKEGYNLPVLYIISKYLKTVIGRQNMLSSFTSHCFYYLSVYKPRRVEVSQSKLLKKALLIFNNFTIEEKQRDILT